jgi:gas vesicle protein GvpL/GvpF
MILLPYCIVLCVNAGLFPKSGVTGSDVHSLAESHLAVAYSPIEKSRITADTFQKSALEFHNVVHAIFAQSAVVPFRFPTWLSEAELRQHVREHCSRYQAFLQQHREHVQMEVRIRLAAQATSDSATGTEHLRSRAAQLRTTGEAAEAVQQSLSGEALEWRQREIPEGLRLFALVERCRIVSFREALARLGPNLGASGPWPATEFLEEPAKIGPK